MTKIANMSNSNNFTEEELAFEQFAIITDFPNYAVSTLGRVLNIKTQQYLAPQNNGKGYLRVGLCRAALRKFMSIHRLVGAAFIPNPEDHPQIDHVNHVKTDNRLSNLRWVSAKANNLNKKRIWRGSIYKMKAPNLKKPFHAQYQEIVSEVPYQTKQRGRYFATYDEAKDFLADKKYCTADYAFLDGQDG
jgi:hypothetical protein